MYWQTKQTSSYVAVEEYFFISLYKVLLITEIKHNTSALLKQCILVLCIYFEYAVSVELTAANKVIPMEK